MSQRVLIHRYDNEPDILAVEERGYSDVYDRSRLNEFDLIVVLPTGAAKTQVTVVADAVSGQLVPEGGEPWPGRDDFYGVRVYVENVRYTTHARVRQALVDAEQWVGQWKVKRVDLDLEDLFEPDTDPQYVYPSGGHEIPMAESPLDYEASQLDDSGEFDPSDVEDARRHTVRSIAVRQGQPEFRRSLLDAYGGRCAISGCDAKEALEAAHIVGYLGPATNHVQNGLLLRADLHTLFDRGLIGVVPGEWTVIVHPDLWGTTYEELHGIAVRIPASPEAQPNANALRSHLRAAGLGVS